MFLFFRPFSFLFLSFYFLTILILLCSSNFFFFWGFIELSILIFIGLRYTLFSNSVTSLILYFLIQTFSSFGLFVAVCLSSNFFFSIFFIIKLSMFPFHFWFLSVVYRFPIFPLWLVSTFHKIPIFYIISIFSLRINYEILVTSCVLSLFVSGLSILGVSELRYLILLSSIGNNSWIVFRSFSRLFLFILFFLFYSFRLYFLLRWIDKKTKRVQMRIVILSLSGIPPFPIFFIKVRIVMILIKSIVSSFLLIPILIGSSFMLIGYLLASFKSFFYFYSF